MAVNPNAVVYVLSVEGRGSARSEIGLRGMGDRQTVVTVNASVDTVVNSLNDASRMEK